MAIISPPMYSQGQVVTAAVSARNDRQMLQGMFLPGVVQPGDMKVIQGLSGLTVRVAAGVAYVPAASANHGHYRIVNDSEIILTHDTVPVGGNFRLDQIIVEVQDPASLAGPSVPSATIRILKGTTESSGVTLANRTGAAAFPSTSHCLRLADVLVPSGGGPMVMGTNIRGRRAFARGAYRKIVGTSGNASPAGLNAYAALFSSMLDTRIECRTGVTIRQSILLRRSGTAAQEFGVTPSVDGSAVVGTATSVNSFGNEGFAANTSEFVSLQYDHTGIAAGSHVFGWHAWIGNASGTFYASVTTPVIATVEEIYPNVVGP